MWVMANLLMGPIDVLLKDADSFSQKLNSKGLKTTQLRKLHSHVTKLWLQYSTYRIADEEIRKEKLKEILEELKFVKVFLAYQQGRDTKGYDELNPKISQMIDSVNDEITFERFKKYIDALVAYAKYYENK